jgi:chaperone modulatory protein CbpM
MMIDLEEFLAQSGIDGATMERWFTRTWIAFPQEAARSEISEIDAARAVFIRDLQNDMGVNDEGIDVVLHLVDQLHGLRRALLALRGEWGTPRG